MNKVIQANLAGLAFTFDADAYAQLDDYLAKIDNYFRGSQGHADIMHDIEARLAELFTANLKGRNIVTIEDVYAACKTLGSPEQLFGDVADDYAEQREPATAVNERSYRKRGRGYSRYGKKLMRDGEEKVLGGVCAGLSAYFGIENPVWIRIAFLVSVFGAGFGVIPYIILWIALPEARTSGDKLAMRGEPIDVNSISEQVEQELTQITNRIQEWGDEVNRTDWKAKFDKSRKGQRSKRDENFMA